jgi:hypothetical protein
MLKELHELVFLFLNLMGFVIIFSVFLCLMWVVLSNFYVYRRGGLDGLLRWHRNNVRHGYNDAKSSLAILGLGLFSLLFCIPSAYDPLTGFCTLLSAVVFLMMAAFVGERRKHWPMLKASAIEVILTHSPPNPSR